MGPDHPVEFHLLNDARSAIVSDLEAPLNIGDRRIPRLGHDRNRLVEHLIYILSTQLDPRSLGIRPNEILVEDRTPLTLQERHESMDLVFRHERPVETLQDSGSGRKKQHIAHAQKVVGALLVEDRTTVRAGRDLKG